MYIQHQHVQGWLCRDCLACGDFFRGSFTGTAMAGGPFTVLSWRDCCAVCQLTSACAAWVCVTPAATNNTGLCRLLGAITGLTVTPSRDSVTMTGSADWWWNGAPPPPAPAPIISPPPPGSPSPAPPRYPCDPLPCRYSFVRCQESSLQRSHDFRKPGRATTLPTS
jgi:hypothetical protein